MANKSPYVERNSRMLLHLLLGKTLADVGEMYGLTGTGVQQCVSKLLKNEHPEIYKEVKSDNTHLVNIRKLRRRYGMKEAG